MTGMKSGEESVREFVDEYRKKYPIYEKYAKTIEKILVASIKKEFPECKYLHIKSRAKKLDSFKKKIEKHDDNDELKYKNPMEDITDLAGVRVVVYFPKAVSQIGACIKKEFEIIENLDVGKKRMEQGIFGYQSIHYLVSIKTNQNKLPEVYTGITGLVGEIQVRTILQHAWAEMEHDINYKSIESTPTSTKRRFIALAGMLEIADNEFQKIQDEDENVRGSIETSIYDDLTEKVQEERATPPPGAVHDGCYPGEVRDLVAKKEYDAAITLYSQMIEDEPRMHTHYIGRAKAKFLSGDRSSALDDIAEAENLCPNDKSILSIKQQIEEGNFIIKNPMAEAWKLANWGNKELSEGKGKKAFEYYLRSEQLGYHLSYTIFNKAMACTLTRDFEGAFQFLAKINTNAGSMTELNAIALRAIVAAISNNPKIEKIWKPMLKNKLKEIQSFNLSGSPLRHLYEGFKKHPESLPKSVEIIFSMLNSKE